MTGQKRENLLTRLERDRLTNRTSMTDMKARSSNDVRVRKKLSAWLNNTVDAELILEYLPEDQTIALIEDHDIYSLLYLVERLIEIKKIYPVVGPIGEPEKWAVVIDENRTKPASDEDIWRSKLLADLIIRLNRFVGDVQENPLCRISKLEKLERMELGDRIHEDEMVGLKKFKEISAGMVARADEEMIKAREKALKRHED